MIRSYNTLGKLEDKDPAPTKVLIKRKFVPIHVGIDGYGQYKTFNEKLPFKAKKVVGAILIHNTPEHKMYHHRVFFGFAPTQPITSKLIRGLSHDLLTKDKHEYWLEGKEGEKLYVAIPEDRSGYHAVQVNGSYSRMTRPVDFQLEDHWTGFKETYRVRESLSDELGAVRVRIFLDEDG